MSGPRTTRKFIGRLIERHGLRGGEWWWGVRVVTRDKDHVGLAAAAAARGEGPSLFNWFDRSISRFLVSAEPPRLQFPGQCPSPRAPLHPLTDVPRNRRRIASFFIPASFAGRGHFRNSLFQIHFFPYRLPSPVIVATAPPARPSTLSDAYRLRHLAAGWWGGEKTIRSFTRARIGSPVRHT